MNMLLVIAWLVLIVTSYFNITNAGNITTPQQLIYEGELLDNQGNPLTGKYDFRFSLWSNQEFETTDTIKGTINVGATDFNGWQEVHSIELTGGEFSLKLGSHTPFITELFDNTNIYLQIEVKKTSNSDINFELIDMNSVNNAIDRTLINTIPFAFNADKLDFHDLGYAPGEIPFIDQDTGKLPESIIPIELLKPTDGINGNSFTLDIDGDADANDLITLKFGDSLNKTLIWNSLANHFEFNDNVYITGDLVVTGTIRSTNLRITGDTSFSDYIDLGFGEDLDARMRYDTINNKFVLNRNLEITEIIDSDGNSGQDGQVLSATGTGKNLWQNMSNSIVPFITSTTESFVPTSSIRTLTINGINFLPTSLINIPDFDGAIDSTQIISPTELRVDITAGKTEASYDIEVSNNDVSNTQWSGNGEGLILVNNPDGSKSNTPGESCEIIFNLGYSTGDGNYWIDQDGGSASNSFQVYCDMSTYSDDTVIPNSTKADILDVNFQMAIAQHIGKSWADVTSNDLESITNLNLWGRNINSIEGVSAMPNLEKFYPYKNNITSIPAEIGNLTNLTILSFRYNDILTIPPEIGNLTNLTNLTLGNNLSTLPSEIGNLTSLTYLALGEHKLTTFPSEIGNLSNLTTAYFSGTNLTYLPIEIKNIGSSQPWVSLNIANSSNLTSLPLGPGGVNRIEIIRYGTPLICADVLVSGWGYCQ